MYIEFIKEHPIGIKKGVISNESDTQAKKYINEGYGKVSNLEDYSAFAEKIAQNKPSSQAAKFAKKSKEARFRVNGKPPVNGKGKKKIGKEDKEE